MAVAMHWFSQIGNYARLMRLHRPIGTLLLLWPVLWALWIAARGVPDVEILLVFILGTLCMRSAGCVINDYADRHIDGHVQRTRERPLATGVVSAREALTLFALLVGLSAALVLTLNRVTIYLSFIAIALAIIYPYMKRYTYVPQVFLGAAFGWGVPMAFAALTGEVPMIAWAIMTCAVIWAVVYDTQYAMVDRADDIRIGVKSTAILFGAADRYFIILFQCLMLLGLLLVGGSAGLRWPYFVAIAVGAGLAVYQQILIHTRAPERCFKAFMNNNWYGAVVFAGIALSYQLAPFSE